jgi:hypothetical protein
MARFTAIVLTGLIITRIAADVDFEINQFRFLHFVPFTQVHSLRSPGLSLRGFFQQTGGQPGIGFDLLQGRHVE